MKKLRHIWLFAALVLFLLIFTETSDAQAALKPSVIEEKVILYTDSEPYKFRFINLDSDAKLDISSSNEAVIKIKDSKAVPQKKREVNRDDQGHPKQEDIQIQCEIHC